MTSLHWWYLEHIGDGRYILHGIVTGHPKLPDAYSIHTSYLLSISQDEQNPSNFVFQTKNTAYHQSMEDCHYERCLRFVQAYPTNPKLPGYDQWAAQLGDFVRQYEQQERPACEASAGSILLRLSNCQQYYFDSMDICTDGATHIPTKMRPHVGMYQDSVICRADLCSYEHDLRYFPHRAGNIDFYHWEPEGLPVYIENSGNVELHIEIKKLVYLIAPEERLLITPDHAKPWLTLTSRQDLYDVWDLRQPPDDLPPNPNAKKLVYLDPTEE